MAKIRFTAEELADIVTNNDIDFSAVVSDVELLSHNTTDTDWGNGDGSSCEESSLDDATAHIANQPNNDIDNSADTTTNVDNRTISRENTSFGREDDEREPLVSNTRNYTIDESIDFTGSSL